MATGRRCIRWPSSVIIWVVTRCCTLSWTETSMIAESSVTDRAWTRWSWSNRARSGTKHSMTNIPPGSSARHAGEALRLPRLAEQAEQRVEHQVHQPEPAADRYLGHVTDGDRDRVAAGLSPQPFHHRGRGVKPLYGDPAGGQRQRDPARPDGQLQHPAA